MPNAGSQTVGPTVEVIYDDINGCTSFLVRVDSGSTSSALIGIPGLHAFDKSTGVPSEFHPIPIGGEQEFKLEDLGIRKVFAAGDGGSADLEFGPVSKTTAR